MSNNVHALPVARKSRRRAIACEPRRAVITCMANARSAKIQIREAESERYQRYRKQMAMLARYIHMAAEGMDEVGPLIRQVGTSAERATYRALEQALEQAFETSGVLVEREPRHE